MTVLKTRCRVCGKEVLVATSTDGSKQHEYYEVDETKMLVIVGIRGDKRINLEPCAKAEPLYAQGKEPDICFAHVKHGCRVFGAPPPSQLAMDSSTGTSMTTNVSLGNQASPAPQVPAVGPTFPIQVPENLPR